jgi:magnesium-transporting ATPase (P-type)
LAKVCNYDNRYAEDPSKPLIISSKLIVEKYGGVEGIMKKLGTNPKTGISPDEVEERRRIFGENFFPPPHIKSFFELVMENFEDTINLMLLAACIVSLIIGYINEGFPQGMIEGTSIAIALLIIVTVNSVNNYTSERRLAALVKLSDKQKIPVFRGSEKPFEIDGDDLVVGDLFQFEEADRIPCDAIVVEGQDIACHEAELTGEPDAVDKVPITSENYTDGAMGTLLAKSEVTSGKGVALVMAVGRRTVSGIITEAT